jgi:hypothetical protein
VTDYTELITSVANQYGVEARLVLAIVSRESSGNPWAWNPEPAYRYLWDVQKNKPFRALTPSEIASATPPADFHFYAGDRDQEWWAQRASWGLMQIMGAVARELGFTGPYLPQLADPQTGLTYGVKHLKNLLGRAKGDVKGALSAYNSGGFSTPQGASYAAAVLTIYNKLPKL